MYWERNKFPNRTLFAPFAHKTQLNTRKFAMEDVARVNTTRAAYNNKPWFRELKSKYVSSIQPSYCMGRETWLLCCVFF